MLIKSTRIQPEIMLALTPVLNRLARLGDYEIALLETNPNPFGLPMKFFKRQKNTPFEKRPSIDLVQADRQARTQYDEDVGELQHSLVLTHHGKILATFWQTYETIVVHAPKGSDMKTIEDILAEMSDRFAKIVYIQKQVIELGITAENINDYQ